jgi:hypothetical protein
MKACFADYADVPIVCSHDIGQPYNCLEAVPRDACPYWHPERALRLCKGILENSPYEVTMRKRGIF